jgi:hypothetical protein
LAIKRDLIIEVKTIETREFMIFNLVEGIIPLSVRDYQIKKIMQRKVRAAKAFGIFSFIH